VNFYRYLWLAFWVCAYLLVLALAGFGAFLTHVGTAIIYFCEWLTRDSPRRRGDTKKG